MLAASVALALSAATVPVEIALEPGRPRVSLGAGECRVVAAPVGGDPERLVQLRPVEARCPAPAETAQLALDPAAVWELRVVSPSLWSAPRTLAPAVGTPRAILKAWPVAKLNGTVKTAKEFDPGPALTAIFTKAAPALTPGPDGTIPLPRSDDTAREPEGQTSCAIVEGAFSCVLPADALDVRLRVPGFVSRVLWNLDLSSTAARDIGTWQLVPGASVIGRVVSDAGGVPLAGCTVEIAEMTSAPSLEALARQGRPAATATTDIHGHFSLEGLQAGRYVVTASRANLAPTRVFPVVVEERAETELEDPIRLGEPLELEVRVSPPLDPFSRPWTVELDEKSVVMAHSLDVAFSARLGEDGTLRRRGLRPGLWGVSVLDSSGNRFVRREFELSAAVRSLDLEVDWVEVEGAVRLGQQPLAAHLTFLDSSYAIVELDCGEEGQFVGVLPHEGRYDVEVAADAPRVRRRLEGVVVRADESGRARLELELSDVEVHGRVVTEDGEPVGGALVILRQAADGIPSTLASEPDGSFALHGLAEGRIFLSARATHGGTSMHCDPQSIEVRSGTPAPPVVLVLRPDDELLGRVVSHSGQGVSLAVVMLFPERFALTANPVDTATTDAAGAFRMKLTSGQTSGNLVVMAAGYALRAVPWAGGSRDPVELRVDPFGGTVRVVLGGVEEAVRQRRLVVILYQDSALLSLDLLSRTWAALNGVRPGTGAEAVIPRMAPGGYRACVCEWTELLSRGEAAIGREHCVSDRLSPLGEVRLRLPGS
ncbi:MAG: carboxypeptidase-like regulatory domain-containing protein [Acidobacteriota bacterium]